MSPTTDSFMYGDVVPKPRAPVFVNVLVAVPPKYAVYAENSDDDALVNVCSAVQLLALAVLSESVPLTPPSKAAPISCT